MVLLVLLITNLNFIKPVVLNSVVKIEAVSNFELVVQTGFNAEETDDISEGALCSHVVNLRLLPKRSFELLHIQPEFFERLKTKNYLNSDLPPPSQNFYNS